MGLESETLMHGKSTHATRARISFGSRTAALLLQGAIAGAALCSSADGASAEGGAPRPPASKGTIHRHTSDAGGFDTNTFWYDTGKEVVVFDAQFTPALAQAVLADIRKKTKSKLRYLVITHPNPDKFNGAGVFREAGAQVVASAATARDIPGVHAYKKYYFTQLAKTFDEATYPREPKVDLSFERELSLPLEAGGVRLSVLRHSGVASTQTVAHIPELNALIVGDLVHYRTHAWLEGAIRDGKPAPAIADWLEALDELTTYRGATLYGGRGEPAPLATAVIEQKQYLTAMDKLVTDYVGALGPRAAELSSENAPQHFKELSARAQRAFPGYRLPYLIEYGVYGLAQSKLKR